MILMSCVCADYHADPYVNPAEETVADANADADTYADTDAAADADPDAPLWTTGGLQPPENPTEAAGLAADHGR